MIETVIDAVNNVLSGYILITVLILGGLYFSFRTKFVQFRLFGEQIRAVTEKPGEKGGVSSFQALMVSTASRVGTGNIVGVSAALCLGGFGSVFWMWVIAVIGSASAFVESTLAQIYKKKGPDGAYGGPAYYIEGALKNRALAVVFSVVLIITYGIGFNMLASFNLQSTFSSYGFYEKAPAVWPWIIGALVACLVCFCLFGGGKRLVRATSVMVPVMGIIYIIVALFIVLINITSLPSIFERIFREAFDLKAIFGGFSGSCVMYGIKRGLFSNEAGVGSAPNASASAEVTHPVKQGLVQVLSVFIDTILVCSATAFMCMSSGVDPSKELEGAPYVQESLSRVMTKIATGVAALFEGAVPAESFESVQSVIVKVFSNFGPVFITVSMILFAFTTLLGNLYYVDKAIFHIAKKKPSKVVMYIYYVIASLLILLGAGLSADILWGIADITMGAMTLINMPVIFILGKYAFRALSDYTNQRKAGKTPTFKASSIGIKDKTDYWS